ncbi:MAG: IS1595 family transposase [Hyphomonas sp.]|uniref:IS1595 family transposase n=1 Tax=Hyphomonas sp. TaxID=87 RepID=UPI0017B7D915|nr:IS1595 family transposase [Hyphomonas sp.]MBA3069317.1 IS1595 family transposase [Hyphomonas sp.]MBU3921920.1 IS1595 family transposase [Alphaproteobacteria bacterium]MBU4063699.1 IS1595 family transposase [Alphaproteobacteria bacterium]MBU4164340.1 IS1595 family transposase [Alphaproteobacteria bacterium]
MSYLTSPHFHDEEAAYAFVESRVWADGRSCPHCGVVGKSGKLGGESTRIGVYKCYACRKPFTVKIGTIFHDSKVKLHLWLQAIFLIASSKKGISANQLHRTLGVTLKTAWFMGHRIREAMRTGGLAPMGGGGGSVEVDETFFGTEPGKIKKQGVGHKMKVLSLIDRNTKQARSVVIDDLTRSTIWPVVKENVSQEARILTDQANVYKGIGREFSGHKSVNHATGEYVSQSEPDVHTNTVENYFSVFKRGMKGTYQHCGKQHLHRYLAEFDFRYNNRIALGVDDVARASAIVCGISGKRLTYETARSGR